MAAPGARDPCPGQKVQCYQECSAKAAKSAGERGKAQLHRGTVNQSSPAGQHSLARSQRRCWEERVDERTENLGQNSLTIPMNSLLTELEPRDFLLLPCSATSLPLTKTHNATGLASQHRSVFIFKSTFPMQVTINSSQTLARASFLHLTLLRLATTVPLSLQLQLSWSRKSLISSKILRPTKNQCWNVLVLLFVLSRTSQMTQAQDIWIILLDYIYKYSEHPNFASYTKISMPSSARYSFIFISQRIERKQRTLFIRNKPINPPNDIWNSPKNPRQTWDSFLVSLISVGLTSRVLYPTQLLCHARGLWKKRYLRAEKPRLNLRRCCHSKECLLVRTAWLEWKKIIA